MLPRGRLAGHVPKSPVLPGCQDAVNDAGAPGGERAGRAPRLGLQGQRDQSRVSKRTSATAGGLPGW